MKYNGTIAGLTIGAMYSFGTNYASAGAGGFSDQIPGHMGADNIYGFTASYAMGPLSIGGGYSRTATTRTISRRSGTQTLCIRSARPSLYAGYLH